ncbi:Hypothetical protein CCH01_000560 [Clostridium chauvoei JF4335]|uniref:Stage 0 sporulation protein A homolog n=1 Tax=Clostridium chauvoei JF4335 TaxID=1351755 RepID=S6EX13_9CLOT|nr:Hypothetical protein CCH01_000560 [Clostridium chauvoei JF4335]SLK12623.1 Hypothetical protein CCH01_03600 [Clostridium chauvoei JF4335]
MKNILIIEDEKQLLEISKLYLEKEGYKNCRYSYKKTKRENNSFSEKFKNGMEGRV